MRILWRVLAVAAAVLVLAVATIALLLWRSVPPLSGEETVPALGAEVTVRFDALGIPHITAASETDAWTALGYLHARDRLWQMEVMRRAAAGRLAEILGAEAVESDRFLRSLDIARAARAIVSAAPRESRATLEAYVAGVNRWIESPRRPLGVEFRVLRFGPEPWTPEQVVSVERLMSWDLVNADYELSLARAAARIGADRVRDLFPVLPEDGALIIQRGTGTWAGSVAPPAGGRSRERTRADWLPSVLLAEADVPRIPALAAVVLEAAAMSRASNSWVIGPARSMSGKPILANDPHLLLRAPSLWYLAAIETPTLAATGATIPALPAVVIGRNRRIAWGLTNIGVDDVDYVVERLTRDSARVLTPGGWVDVEVERDSIRVRDGAAVPFALRRTPNGPIVDAPPGRGDTATAEEVRVLAMRWNAHDPSDEMSALHGVMRAGTWPEFLAAVSRFKSPQQNWVYADVDGNIGYTASGAVPVRRSGTGSLPTAGWTGEGRWVRYLQPEELPRALNPPDGFIVTANNRVIGPEYPHVLTVNWEHPYRAERIRELILAAGRVDAEAVRGMQMDTLDTFARRMAPMAAEAAGAAGRDDLARLLAAWDGTAGRDRVEPAVFYAWYRALQRLTFADELAGTYAPSQPLHAWMRAGASPWFDDVATPEEEDLAALSLRAMREALPLVDGRKWGEVHPTIGRHALSAMRPLRRLLRLDIGPAPRPGSPYTVNVAGFEARRPPFVNSHAASLRQVVDLADPEAGGLVITSGQSGHPISRRYRDQARMWWRGELRTVPLSADRVEASGVLRLVPR